MVASPPTVAGVRSAALLRWRSDLQRRDVPVGCWRVLPGGHADARRIPHHASGAHCQQARQLTAADESGAAAIEIPAWLVDPTQDGDISLGALRQRAQIGAADGTCWRDGGARDGFAE